MMNATTISYPFLIALLILLIWTPTLQAQDFIQLAKVVETQREMDNEFGHYVAIDGRYAVVGVPREEEDENENNPITFAGAAYVYEREGADNWNLVQKLVASDRSSIDSFGNSVAVSGTSMLIGATGDGEGNIVQAGAVYAFERNANGLWEETQKFFAENRQMNDGFGFEIAMDGDRAAIFIFDQQGPIEGAGAVYIFEKDGAGLWNEVQKLEASDRGVNDFFGRSLALEGDILIVGVHDEDEDTNGNNTLESAGSAYVFERESSGNWVETQKLVADPRDEQYWFGFDVAIESGSIFIGCPRDDTNASGTNSLPFAGSTYIFDKNGQGEWEVSQKLVSPVRREIDVFGTAVSRSGNYLAVAAAGNDFDENETNFLDGAGAVFIFEKDGSGTWNFFQKIVSEDRDPGDGFGRVALSGNHLIVGVSSEEDDLNDMNGMRSAGSVYFFSGGVLGLDDILSDTNYQLYPNPANHDLTIERAEFAEDETFEVYTILGQKVISGNLKGNRTQISISKLSAGMYLLKTPSAVFRFIKN